MTMFELHENAGPTTLATQHLAEVRAKFAADDRGDEPPTFDDHNVAVNGHDVERESFGSYQNTR